MHVLRQAAMAALLLTILTSVADAAQSGTIRVRTQLVQVNVVVRAKGGPAADLKASDFSIFDNGREQRIEVFSVADARSHQPPPASPPAGTVSSRIAATGERVPSITVILFDVLNTPRSYQKDAIKQLVKYLRSMRADDHVALYLLGDQLQVLQDFTDDPEKLIRAVASKSTGQYAGFGPSTTKELLDMVGGIPDIANAQSITLARQRADATSQALVSIAHHLSGVPGRKNMVWMSGGFPFVTETVTTGGIVPSRSGEPIILKSTLKETPDNFSVEIDRAARALGDANVAVYPVDVMGLIAVTPPSGASQRLDSNGEALSALRPPDVMIRLADATGGLASYYNNDFEGAIRRAVSDGEVSYVLGFYSSADSKDKTFHQLKVKVGRKGAEVTHRSGYYPAGNKSLTAEQRQDLFGEVLKSPLNSTQMGLTASATPDPDNPANYLVHIVIDAADVELEQQGDQRVGTLILGFRPESSASKVVNTAILRLGLSDDQYRHVLENGLEFTETVPARAGDQLRVVVQDATSGIAGSVLLPVGGSGPR